MALTTLLSMEKRKVNGGKKRASRRCQPAYHSSPFDKYLIGTTGCATHNNNQTHSDKKNTNQERWNSTETRWRHSHYMSDLKKRGLRTPFLLLKKITQNSTDTNRFLDCFNKVRHSVRNTRAWKIFATHEGSNGKNHYQKMKNFLIFIQPKWKIR